MGKRIENVLDSFNFIKAHTYMKSVNWTWVNGNVPDVVELRECARGLLKQAKKERTTVSTGGFIASYSGKRYSLTFYVDRVWED